MTQKLTIETRHIDHLDLIEVVVSNAARESIIVLLLEPTESNSVSIEFLNEKLLNDLPLMNRLHLIALVLSALVERTTDETEIPLVVESFQIEI